MKLWKKGIALLTLSLMMGIEVIASSKIGITYDGEALQLTQEPKVIQNTTMLPIRAISNELGYVLDWNEKTGEILISDGLHQIQLKVNNKEAYVDGICTELEVAPQVVSSTTYVPLRFIGEAFGLEVKWDEVNQCVKMESKKYTVDKTNKKLMVKTESGKKVLADINTLEGNQEVIPVVDCKKTKYGSELITVSETISGALTGFTETTFYIKDGKVIDKNERALSYVYEAGIATYENQIAFCTDRYLRIYDDQTGTLIQQYDMSQLMAQGTSQEVGFDLMKLGKNYALGRSGGIQYVFDFQLGKMTSIYEQVPEEDRGFIYQTDFQFPTDDIKLVWVQENALVFKYYSITEDKDKTITYKIGEGIIS